MKRPLKFEGKCGKLWIQQEHSVQGHISIECSHENGFYLTTLRIIAKEEALETCEKCPFSNKEY